MWGDESPSWGQLAPDISLAVTHQLWGLGGDSGRAGDHRLYPPIGLGGSLPRTSVGSNLWEVPVPARCLLGPRGRAVYQG